MNLTAYGNQNIVLHGNPEKTFFKSIYKKHTNFGLQRFRIDYEGSRLLNFNTPTHLDFKIPRYAELLYDSYIVVTLPNIYSPFFYDAAGILGNQLRPYEFKWINEIGSHMIDLIEVHSGGTTLAKFSGEYLSCLKERDYNESKKKLWDEMTGNVKELTNPELIYGNENVYPNAMYVDDTGVEPSIRSRKLYIPLNAFFCDSSKLALPLVALQYQEISIKIQFKPVSQLYTINNVDKVTNSSGLSYRSAPNPNIIEHQMWHFLQPPTTVDAATSSYDTTRNDWNSDIHIIGTYIFLGQEERRFFAQMDHDILVKEIFEYEHLSVAGTKVLDIDSKNLISNYMFRFRRSDAHLRNQWNNYTNWAFNDIIPQSLSNNLPKLNDVIIRNPNNFFITQQIGDYAVNQKNILVDMGILCEGTYREKVLDSGVYNFIEKFKRTNGNAKNGLYCYNFCLNSDRTVYQPSGAMNMNRFSKVSFEFNTIESPINFGSEDNPAPTVEIICDVSQNPIGFRKNIGTLKEYNYDLKIFEERYNVLHISAGKIGYKYAS